MDHGGRGSWTAGKHMIRMAMLMTSIGGGGWTGGASVAPVTSIGGASLTADANADGADVPEMAWR